MTGNRHGWSAYHAIRPPSRDCGTMFPVNRRGVGGRLRNSIPSRVARGFGVLPGMNPARRQSAFSLVEVMVAVFILAVALVGLVGGITTALVSAKEAELHTQAVQLAAARVELLRADDLFVDGESTGTVGSLQWRQTISAANVAGLHEIELAVLRAAGDTPVYSLKTLLYQTPPERPGDARKEKERRDTGRSKRGSSKRP